jgi:hypothetical protein
MKPARRLFRSPRADVKPQSGRHFVNQAGGPDRPAPDDVMLPDELAEVADENPSSLLDVIGAAVHPLEIAASLETCGLSNNVVHKRFGYRDVFSLAEHLYDSVRFRAAPVTDSRSQRPGGLPDLGRGVVFAAPTLMFAGAAIALHSWLPNWTVPLALICGWGFSQFVAYVGLNREARGAPPGATVVWALLAVLSCCALVGALCKAFLGGSYFGVLFATGASAFMTASAELLVKSKERLIGLLLVPGALGSLVFITREPFALPVPLAVALTAASVGGTVVAALWHVPVRWWRDAPVTWGDFPTAMHYVANGCCCGAFVALFMVLEPAKSGLLSWPGAAAYPMVLSLGVMEWQLRTLRAGIRHASHDTFSLAHFVKTVRRKLARSTVTYLAVLAFLTASIQALAEARGAALPASLLAAGSCLALAFFLALVVASCGRVDLVLRAWLVGLGVYGALGLFTVVVGTSWAFHDDQLAFCVAVSVAAAALVLAARRVVLNPVSHG